MSPPDPVPEAPFAAPWQAQAFAIVVALHRRGLFTWAEWTEALGAELARADARADGAEYYAHWVAALERVLQARGVSNAREIAALAEAWARAARATPHGTPITLENDPHAAR